MTAALKGAEVDYTPCVPYFWRGYPRNEAFIWNSEEERLAFYLETLGVDFMLQFGVSHRQPPFRSWVENSTAEKYPLLHSELDTPKGKLEAVIKKTEDYQDEHIPFFSDWTVSRYVKPWIENLEDVEKFASIYLPPESPQIANAKARLTNLQNFAQKWGVPIMGGGLFSLNAVIHLMGAEQAVLASVEMPEVIDSLNQVISSVDRRKLEVMLSLGVRIVLRNGWYDTTDFWAPDQYETRLGGLFCFCQNLCIHYKLASTYPRSHRMSYPPKIDVDSISAWSGRLPWLWSDIAVRRLSLP